MDKEFLSSCPKLFGRLSACSACAIVLPRDERRRNTRPGRDTIPCLVIPIVETQVGKTIVPVRFVNHDSRAGS